MASALSERELFDHYQRELAALGWGEFTTDELGLWAERSEGDDVFTIEVYPEGEAGYGLAMFADPHQNCLWPLP